MHEIKIPQHDETVGIVQREHSSTSKRNGTKAFLFSINAILMSSLTRYWGFFCCSKGEDYWHGWGKICVTLCVVICFLVNVGCSFFCDWMFYLKRRSRILSMRNGCALGKRWKPTYQGRSERYPRRGGARNGSWKVRHNSKRHCHRCQDRRWRCMVLATVPVSPFAVAMDIKFEGSTATPLHIFGDIFFYPIPTFFKPALLLICSIHWSW